MEKTPGQLEIVLQYFDDFSTEEIKQLSALDELYKEWNAKINVISRRDIDSLYEKHILHSLAIATAFDFQPDMEVIDIGTGGGFPGIPLAIFFPHTKFHLVDSIGKKIKVAGAIAAAVGLNNVTTAQIRAEDIKGRKFDAAVSRAVAPLHELWTWSRPLLRKSQFGLICLKGGNLAAEISASGLHPRIIEINQLFDREYFKEKYLLQVPY
ncbi:MAG TPA: 16S rRNA (guanine(527)-N(7))-methyltransferase RsmG [Puia sp.]|jgi:16S rRNA (guanine527-N7)-methyltransferase|nr:16S rRNA (guanine(527)-N(7))-methyltransferase RsmG [Puia sp.]